MAPFEILYERKCIFTLGWFEPREVKLISCEWDPQIDISFQPELRDTSDEIKTKDYLRIINWYCG